MVRIEEEDDNAEDKGAGLIDLDMGAFGSGNMSDPLRHAVGMRTAQDQCKMRMWNSFPQLFQNTIFHGEQDAEIKKLRCAGSLCDRLARGRQLKQAGNDALKGASSSAGAAPIVEEALSTAGPDVDPREEELAKKVAELEGAVLKKEQELKALRQELVAAKSELTELKSSVAPDVAKPAQRRGAGGVDQVKEGLEKAITSYEKAAGLLRYVECVRPDWKNDDGSYKGIEDEHLIVDASALVGDAPEAEEARELVASCYLNVALACQKLGDYERMRSACDEVLQHVNPQSVKAFYRRAQARVALPSGLEADRDAALQDLHRAVQLAPQDKEIRGLYTKLKSEKKSQELSDRSAFAGMFDRGEVVKNDPREEGEKPPKLDLNDPKVQAMLDIRPGPGGFITAP